MTKASRARAMNMKVSEDNDDVEPAIDAFINAGNETRGINCYRIPILAFYENDLLSK